VYKRQVEARETLPSFLYQPVQQQVDQGALKLPWSKKSPDRAVGVLARDEGMKSPGRLIASAKSWLCHTGVDRTAELLPWHGAADVQRLSPVEASAEYLRHMRDAWNHAHPDHPLESQDVVLTLPASFDEFARELTVQAANAAGLPRVVLVEEPQAAFYAWVYRHSDDWESQVREGQTILVCDIGGGTSDFTLIRARASTQSEEGRVQFHRVAVGNHLILGGDNLDLALASHLEDKITAGGKLPPHQWDVLVRSCQRVKEQLLAVDAPESLTINLPGAGSKLLAGGVQVVVEREEAVRLLLDGFLPQVRLTDQPQRRQSGFQEFGLPFAADPAITRYLAAFLTTHRSIIQSEANAAPGHDPARPDVLLLNGGFFASPVLRQQLIDVLASWFRSDDDPDWAPHVLDNERLDLAVARGAAYYGMVRRGEGVKIAANLARSYYIRVAGDTPSVVCLVPGSAEPGQDIAITDRSFELLISEPVQFPLFVSSTRLVDQPGEVVPIDREQMTPLPPIRTVLKTRSRREAGALSVRLHARLTEIGTIDLWCADVDRDRRWRLQFDVRSATQTDVDAHLSDAEQQGFVDESDWQACSDILSSVYAAGGSEKPDGLVKRLARALDAPRHEWPTSLLRRIWEQLMELDDGRRRSAAHEARWLNLLGYSLRPGYGLAVDDWRVAETWRHVQGKLVHHTPAVRNEAVILWRRIAGGLTKGQQLALAEPMLASIRNLHRRYTTGKAKGDDLALRPNELSETWRLVGSLELLHVPLKVETGNMLATLLPKRKLQNVQGPMLWALGRLGQRVPVYGPLNTVVPREVAQPWLEQIFRVANSNPAAALAIMQLARRTDDRYRDLSAEHRREAAGVLEGLDAAGHLIQLVRDGGQLDDHQARESLLHSVSGA
jgi:molecular chaperone DnaK (HSP70)